MELLVESWVLVCHWGAAVSGPADWETELGPSSRQSTEAPQKFVLPGCSLRGSHLEPGTLVALRFVSDSHVLRVLVLLVEYSIGFFGRFFSYSCATLGSTVESCFDQYLAVLDELHTFSTLRQTRILKCCSPFCRRTEKRAQSMLLVEVLLRAVLTWKTGHSFYEL